MRFFRQLQPAVAALLAACVLLLGLAAWSPDLHAALHGHHAGTDMDAHERHPDDADAAAVGGDDHVCAVTLFAHGCTSPVAVLDLAPLALTATSVAQFTELLLTRTLRGPERACGPPVLA